jgi:hypothetical protein
LHILYKFFNPRDIVHYTVSFFISKLIQGFLSQLSEGYADGRLFRESLSLFSEDGSAPSCCHPYLGADCCDTVGSSGLPSLPGRTFLRPFDFAMVEDTEICFVGSGVRRLWLPCLCLQTKPEEKGIMSLAENCHTPERFEFNLKYFY